MKESNDKKEENTLIRVKIVIYIGTADKMYTSGQRRNHTNEKNSKMKCQMEKEKVSHEDSWQKILLAYKILI